MKKYQQLLQEYEGWIANLKRLRDQIEEQRTLLRSMDPNDRDSFYVDVVENLASLETEYHDGKELLDSQVREEYSGIPFRASREEAVRAFYREANL